MRYQILDESGTVINTIFADEAFVEQNYPGRWLLLPEATQASDPGKLSRLDFRRRFTLQEKRDIYDAATSNVDVRIFLDDVADAEYIDLSDPDTVAGVMTLEAIGLIPVGRAAQILG